MPIAGQQRLWHSLALESVLHELDTDPTVGLSEAEAAHRRDAFGANELVDRGSRSVWRMLWEQLSAVMVLVLLAAGGVSLALGDVKDALAILAIVVLNAALGLSQEYRAEQAMAALKRLAAPNVRAYRDGAVRDVSARTLVLGDVLLVEAGNLVAADCRILESANLSVEEAALTGESAAVDKDASAVVAAEAPLGDRFNMLYSGTAVSYGRGRAVVVATGMQTELGRIASALQAVPRSDTPLQRRLDQLARRLAVAALILVGLIFGFGLLRGEEPGLMFLTSVSLAVAAVPEGLPAVVTISLALGAQRMLRRKALIRQLPAVETLGSVTVICSDKTGTLTQNRMSVSTIEAAGSRFDPAQRLDLGDSPALQLMLVGAGVCNDVFVRRDPRESVGDPTETALVEAAGRFGLWKDELASELPRVTEVPFDSNRKRMTTVHRIDGREHVAQIETGYVAFSKGAVDALLDVSSRAWRDSGVVPVTAAVRADIAAADARLSASGARVLGLAYRALMRPDADPLEQDLVFVGMFGLIDPPREDARQAVAACLAAGIRPVMITGDHPLTAHHIAQQLDFPNSENVLAGVELEHLSPRQLAERASSTAVFARVSPAHKLAIVAALQQQGEIVAMTGDGVNDAPALKQADIGVAMGLMGTDVAREAADMVLLDDRFATILAAVEEGRAIYDNIRKFLRYLLSTNAGELWVMLLGPVLGLPLPLMPLQILWINLVTDGLPALALAVEPAEAGVMRRPPRPSSENLLDRPMVVEVLWVGLLMAFVTLSVGLLAWRTGNPDWQTMLFTTIALTQMGQALAVRSEKDSIFRIGLLSNPAMIAAVLATVVLQGLVVYVPALQSIFGTRPLEPGELLVCLGSSTILLWAVELKKLLQR
jgi:P-type Ca2+ transporter type 2C